MVLFDSSIFTLLGLVLALVTTLVAAVSYYNFEKAKKRLSERHEQLQNLKLEFGDFRARTSEAFSERNDLRERISNLEGRLKAAYGDLEKERADLSRLAQEFESLRADHEVSRRNLSDAYKRLRERGLLA